MRGFSVKQLAFYLIIFGFVAYFVGQAFSTSKEVSRYKVAMLQLNGLVNALWNVSEDEIKLKECTPRALLDQLLDHAEVQVSSLITKERTLRHPWEGDMDVTPSCVADGKLSGWLLTYNKLPMNSCIALMQGASAANIRGHGVMGAVGANKAMLTLPFAEEAVKQACQTFNGTIMFAMTAPGQAVAPATAGKSTFVNDTAVPEAYLRALSQTKAAESH